MGTKPVYKILWFEQSGVTDKVQKSAKENWGFRSSGLWCWVTGSVSQNF